VNAIPNTSRYLHEDESRVGCWTGALLIFEYNPLYIKNEKLKINEQFQQCLMNGSVVLSVGIAKWFVSLLYVRNVGNA
jgi:hypothetical protein